MLIFLAKSFCLGAIGVALLLSWFDPSDYEAAKTLGAGVVFMLVFLPLQILFPE